MVVMWSEMSVAIIIVAKVIIQSFRMGTIIIPADQAETVDHMLLLVLVQVPAEVLVVEVVIDKAEVITKINVKWIVGEKDLQGVIFFNVEDSTPIETISILVRKNNLI